MCNSAGFFDPDGTNYRFSGFELKKWFNSAGFDSSLIRKSEIDIYFGMSSVMNKTDV